MSVFHNLADLAAGLKDLLRRVDILETNDGAGYTSVDEGSFRVRSNEGLLVEGSQKVSGWLIVTGTLKVVGAFLLEGATTMTGNLVSSGTALFTGLFTTQGTTRFEGDTTQQGPFHIVGATDLTGTMSVKPGGKVIVEGTSAATLQNGALSFATGAKLTAYATGATLQGSSAGTNVAVENGSASLNFGTRRVSCEADGVLLSGPVRGTDRLDVTGVLTAGGTSRFDGLMSNPGMTTTSTPANVYVDSAAGNRLYRVSSARRFKTAIRDTELPASVLDVRVKDWIDAGQFERAVALDRAPRPLTFEQQSDWDALTIRRVPGVIAEEVYAADPSGMFNTFDADGEVDGVAYDRLAYAYAQASRDDLLKVVADLTARLDAAGL